jgi:hypothetical protein
MFLPGGFAMLVADFLSNGEFHLKHYPAVDAGSTACAALQNQQRGRARTGFGWTSLHRAVRQSRHA